MDIRYEEFISTKNISGTHIHSKITIAYHYCGGHPPKLSPLDKMSKQNFSSKESDSEATVNIL